LRSKEGIRAQRNMSIRWGKLRRRQKDGGPFPLGGGGQRVLGCEDKGEVLCSVAKKGKEEKAHYRKLP